MDGLVNIMQTDLEQIPTGTLIAFGKECWNKRYCSNCPLDKYCRVTNCVMFQDSFMGCDDVLRIELANRLKNILERRQTYEIRRVEQ